MESESLGTVGWDRGHPVLPSKRWKFMTMNEFLPRSNRAFVIQRCSETSDVAFRDDPPLPEGHPPENYDFGQFMTMHDDEEADIRLLTTTRRSWASS